MIKLLKESLLAKALVAIIAVLLPILIGFAVMYKKNSVYLKQRILDTITVMAEAYEGQVYQFLEMSKRRAQDFSSDGFIKNQLQKIDRGNPYTAKALSTHLIKTRSSSTRPSTPSISSLWMDVLSPQRTIRQDLYKRKGVRNGSGMQMTAQGIR